jgi:uncharacterized UPF0160 family protein
MITKIITHDGIFHADDVMSIALMLEFIRPTLKVERTRNISADEFTNPDIWIVDVGGQYDQVNNNYDHHQDNSLPAACMLVLIELVNLGKIDTVMHEELFDAVYEISDIDCNGPADKNGFQVNTLIKSFNSIEDGFELAVDVCRKYIQSCKANAAKSEESKKIWDAGEKMSNIRVCDAFPIHWKRYKEENFLVYPQAGKWNVISADSEKFPLLDYNNAAVFIHVNRFIAVFNSKQEALECAFDSGLAILGKQKIEKINKIKSKF